MKKLFLIFLIFSVLVFSGCSSDTHLSLPNFINVFLTDTEGQTAQIDSEGFLQVRPMESTGEIINFKLMKVNGNLTLSQNLSVDDSVAYFTDLTGVTNGTTLRFYCNGRIVQNNAEVVLGNNITLAQESDINCSNNDYIEYGITNANIAASIGSPEEFCFVSGNNNTNINETYHINKLVVNIRSAGAMDDGLFGDLPQLDYPVTYRVYDGYAKNLFPVSRTGAARTRGADIVYVSKAPSGQYAVAYTFRFGGPENYGGIIKLNGPSHDRFCVLIRSDLSELYDFENVIIGHVAEKR